MTTMVALFAALAPTAFTAAGATAPDSVSLTLEGCRNDGSILLPIAGKFVCPTPAYTSGNLGKGWNELDLVPYRLTANAGNSAPDTQTYSLTIVVDNEDAGAPGYDFLSEPVLNDPLSAESCETSPITFSSQKIANPGLGGIDKSLYRDITITQNDNTTCVYDYFARLALGSHFFPGSSLHANLANETLGSGGIGAKDVSIPVKEISPQELRKNMSATKDSDHSWLLEKSATPAEYRFADTCTTASSGASTTVEVTLTWTKGPGNAQGYTVTTQIYAKNPASRTITVSVTDKIYSGATLLDTKVFSAVDVPANTEMSVGTHIKNFNTGDVASASAPDFNDVATATYTDKVTLVDIPRTTQATASVANDKIGTGSVTNATATITDTESITGNGFSFSTEAPTPSVGSFSGYTAGTKTVGPVVWNSGTLSDSGSVTFNKTVYLDQPRVSSGQLSDTAELSGSSGATSSASAATDLSADATVSITVNKTIPDILDEGESQTFTFRVRNASDRAVVETVNITFAAGETSKSATVSLAPGVYIVSEDVVLGWNHQPDSAPVDLSVKSDGSLACSGSVGFDNTFGPAVARVVKTTEPTGGGRENGWTMCLEGPGAAGGKECVVTAAGDRDLNSNTPDQDGVAVFATALQNGGAYKITEVLKAGVRQSGSTGDCSFNVSYPADFGRVFTCGFTNQELGRIIVKKVTDPAGDSASFAFKLSGGPLAIDMPFSLKGGDARDSGHLQAGSGYQLAEDSTSGWDFAGAVCDDGSLTDNISVSPGEVVTCTVSNTKHGDVGVTKTVSGQVPPAGSSFTFQVRKGASATEAGAILLSDTSDAAGVVDFNGATLSPGSYQLCEAAISAGWVSSLANEAGSFASNSDAVCVGFALDPGEHQRFQVDNTPPPPPPVVVLGAVELPRTGAGMLALLLMTGSALTLAGQAARAGRRRLRRA